MKKTLGQIAHEAGEKAGGWLRKWEDMGEAQRAEWEAIAEAVAGEVEALTETKKCECSSDEACAFVRQRDALSERLGACLRVFEAQQTTGEFTIPPRQEFMDTLREAISNAALTRRP